MSGSIYDDDDYRDRDDDEFLKPLYEDEEPEMPGSVGLFAPGRSLAADKPPPQPSVGIDLRLLSEADTLLARLDALASVAAEPVRQGLVARMAIREAAGWLGHSSHWVHPNDLALREAGLTGSYIAAASTGKLASVMPYTLGGQKRDDEDEAVPEDFSVTLGLGLARLLRRLVEMRSFAPLTSRGAGRAFEALGLTDAEAEIVFMDWSDAHKPSEDPPLLHALSAGTMWRKTDKHRDADLRAGFTAAASMVNAGRLRTVPLPLWAGYRAVHGNRRIDDLLHGRHTASLLKMIAEGARVALNDVDRLTETARLAASFDRTKRSRLTDALDVVIRTPVVTAISLGQRLRITPQAATRLLRELVDGKMIREATGRKSFRAYLV